MSTPPPTSPTTPSSRHPSIFSRPDAATSLSRRAHNSSSTDYGDGLTGPLHYRTTGGLDSEPFRVGGPDLDLMPFIHSSPPSSSLQTAYRQKIEPELWSILRDHGVADEECFLQLDCFRSAARPNAQVDHYAYVRRPYHEGCRPSWDRIADDMYAKIRELGYGNDLKVLVSAKNVTLKGSRTHALEAGSGLRLAWPKVAQSILSLFAEQSLDSWNSLMLVKRSHPYIKGSQEVPTVCIGIQYDSAADIWTAAAPAIKALWKEYTLWAQEGVCLEIVRGFLGGCHKSEAGEPVPAEFPEEHRILRSTPYLGASICPKFMEDQGVLSAASFGCSVTLDQDDQQYGLTNCHVVFPSSNTAESYAHPSAQTYLDASIIPLLPTGAAPSSIPGPIALMMPAKCDLEAYLVQQQAELTMIETRLNDIPIDEEMLALGLGARADRCSYSFQKAVKRGIEKNIESARELLASDRLLGHVYAFSGFRKNKTSKQILDWALIKLEKGKGLIANTVSDPIRHRLAAPCLLGFQDAVAGEVVHKIGRTTRETHGPVNPTSVYLNSKSLGAWPEDEDPSQDKWTLSKPVAAAVELKGCVDPFCEQGDSGAVVFNKSCEVVGLFVTGSMALEMAFFTPQKELIEDIKEKTGATTVHLAGFCEEIDWSDEKVVEKLSKTQI